MSKYTEKQLARKQVELEFLMRSIGIERFHRNDMRNEEHSASQTSYGNAIVSGTVEQLAEGIEAFIEHYRGKRGKRPSYLANIEQAGTKTVALIAIRTVLDIMSAKDMSIQAICLRLGQRVEDQIKFAGLEEHAPQYVAKIMDSMLKKGTKSYSHKREVLNAAARNSGFEYEGWTKETQAHLGSFLVDLVASINFNGEPLLTKVVVDTGTVGANSEIRLVPSEHTAEWISEFQQQNEILAPAYAPCVVPPRPWTSPFDGGFHVKEIASTMSLVRGKKAHVKGLTYEQMPIVYDAINSLQNVAWQVSDSVLDVLKGAMECKLPLGIPQQEPYSVRPAPIPAGMEDLKGKALMNCMTSEEQEAFINWKRDAAEVATQDKVRQNELNQITRIMAEAKKYSNFDAMYFVYSLDYRSRVYVESSLLTPQGGDLQKGLIRFAEGKKLGYRGAYWLAIQGAGVWAAKDENGIALDKKPFPERVRTILSSEFCDMVHAIVEDPLNCTEWCNADKPWQFLNWCFEWSSFLDFCEQGNSHKDFVSHLPIAMDGSCSGTQHYAMILKDRSTAELVNLVPLAKPNDIYGSTSDKFKEKLIALISDESQPMNVRNIASEWVNHANRNLAKPPVMTLVYGSSPRTCHRTTGEYLYDVQAKEDKQARATGRASVKKYNFESVTEAVSTVNPLLWSSVEETQQAAIQGMKFIKQLARFCVKKDISMQWTTPTGFVVTQEIFQTKAKRVETMMFGGTKITLREETNKLDVNKMASSSAPNFIHSMDASHLILVANAMLNKHGLSSMAVIHDSFGVHACDTSKLRRTLLTELVDMYTKHDVMAELLDTNEERALADSKLALPAKGELEYSEVMKATYAFA